MGKKECKSKFEINGQEITRAEIYKYLGDQVSEVWENLYRKRCDKAQGYSAVCQAMSTEVSLGSRLYDIAKLLHQSVFVNGTLINMETWPHCTNERLDKFERIEQTFMRKIINAHSKTPIEALYLELGVVPLRFHLMKRRILYLQGILGRDDKELVKQVVCAQSEKCSPGDFHEQVEKNMKEMGIEKEQLMENTNEKLKIILDEKAKDIAYRFLISKAEKHSKVNEDAYKNCDGIMYFKEARFSPDLANLLFKFRTRTFMVKNNFRNNYKNTNITCPLCESNEDTQEHLFKCFKIRQQYKRPLRCTHEDIYSEDSDTMFQVATTLRELTQIRQQLLTPKT